MFFPMDKMASVTPSVRTLKLEPRKNSAMFVREVTAEQSFNKETVTATCGGSTAWQVDVQCPHEIAQLGSSIGFLASAALVGTVGAVLVRRGSKYDHAFQEEFDTTA
jgi:hypothetical protein